MCKNVSTPRRVQHQMLKMLIIKMLIMKSGYSHTVTFLNCYLGSYLYMYTHHVLIIQLHPALAEMSGAKL